MGDTQEKPKEEIVVIGGGLGGCLTALMLARDPEHNYHVTLVENNSTLLNGASAIAARLHLGGEYPKDDVTAVDCLTGAVVWKMLMPDNIYTSAPPMKFFVSEESTKKHPDDPEYMTVQNYMVAYENIRLKYEKICEKVGRTLEWGKDKIEEALFGSWKQDQFYRKLDKKEYEGYAGIAPGGIAGGFQTQERGLNIPLYLGMIQNALEEEQKNGKIKILTNCRVNNNGIDGKIGHFNVHYRHGPEGKTLHASQVVQCAWQGGPAITKSLGYPEEPKAVKVYKRAMLLVELPDHWETPPAFVMLGESGGMLAPFNNKVALCYIPNEEAAYSNEKTLTKSKTSLPRDWNKLSDTEKEAWTRSYFEEAKKRFPILKDAKPIKIVIRDTLNFQKKLEQRRDRRVKEQTAPDTSNAAAMAPGLRMNMGQSGMQLMQQEQEFYHAPLEVENGRFTLYPTKATYTVRAALEAVHLVNLRSQEPEKVGAVEPPEDTMDYLLSPNMLEKYSLKDLKEPDKAFFDKFFKQHEDLDPLMMPNLWPGTWTARLNEAKQNAEKATPSAPGRSG